MKCDFHTHSTVSDGSFAPDALISHAAQAGVDALSLTDHDDVGGVALASEAGVRLGVEVIPGVELTVSENGGERAMHVLGLGVDPRSPGLQEVLGERRAARRRRLVGMLERLERAGARLDLEALEERASGGAVGRPHGAQALVESGTTPDLETAYRRFLRRGAPGFVPHEDYPAQLAIRLVHDARGVAVLAHPPRSGGVDAPGGLESFVGSLLPHGLDGVEVWHPGHTRAQTRRLARFAREHELLSTGGSDFHGASKPDVRIAHGRGNIRVGQAVYRRLVEAIAERGQTAGS